MSFIIINIYLSSNQTSHFTQNKLSKLLDLKLRFLGIINFEDSLQLHFSHFRFLKLFS